MEYKKYSFKIIITVGIIFFLIAPMLPVQTYPDQNTNEIQAISNRSNDCILVIDEIDICTEIEDVGLDEDKKVIVPTNNIVGRYMNTKNDTTFLVGHTPGIFEDLDKLQVGSELVYESETYIITDKNIYQTDHLDMAHYTSNGHLNLGTCYNQDKNGRWIQRLMVTASKKV